MAVADVVPSCPSPPLDVETGADLLPPATACGLLGGSLNFRFNPITVSELQKSVGRVKETI